MGGFLVSASLARHNLCRRRSGYGGQAASEPQVPRASCQPCQGRPRPQPLAPAVARSSPAIRATVALPVPTNRVVFSDARFRRPRRMLRQGRPLRLEKFGPPDPFPQLAPFARALGMMAAIPLEDRATNRPPFQPDTAAASALIRCTTLPARAELARRSGCLCRSPAPLIAASRAVGTFGRPALGARRACSGEAPR
jgi:hypothetical protein